MPKALIAIFATLAIDSIGIGLIMPILPSLIRDVGHSEVTGWQFGGLLSLYAAMQFLFAPLLGALSDRYGRRPVLLVSLAGAAVDYVFMALAPTLVLLFLGRAISGMTGANMSVASAYITDITREEDRAKRFGQMSAIFGLGFMIGPIMGGLLGEHWVRLPFLVAAGLNATNFALTYFVVPESRRGDTLAPMPGLSFLGPIKPLMEFRFMWGLIFVAVVFAFVGEVAGTIWVLYAEDKFSWNPHMFGLSLTAFGLFHAAIQGVLVGPMTKFFGPRWGLLTAMMADGAAYIGMAFAGQGWMAFALMPLFALGGASMPILQSMLSERVDGARQGALMGLFTGLTSFVSIFAPLSISLLYFATKASFPGTVWLFAAAMYLVSLPFLLALPRRQEPQAVTSAPQGLSPRLP
jgi:DHA1 family tetracycline resistance protein-like MFS transporter